MNGVGTTAATIARMSPAQMTAFAKELIKNGCTELANLDGSALFEKLGEVAGTVAMEALLGKGVSLAFKAFAATKTGAALIGEAEKVGASVVAKVTHYVSDEQAAAATQRIQSALRSPAFYSGAAGAELLPEIAQVAANKLVKMSAAGAVKFEQFAKEMTGLFGENVKPYLEKVYREEMISLNLADKVDEAGIKTVKEAERVGARYGELKAEGHAVDRHGEQVTERQLDERAVEGKDPITGTTDDAYLKDANGNPLLHRSGKNATKFTSEKALVKAEEFVKNSQEYKNALNQAMSTGQTRFEVTEIKLEDVYGANYKNEVFGKTRIGSKNNPTGVIETDFTNGTITSVFKKDASGKWTLHTMYPEPK